jgi:hypothetical protein
MKLIRILENIFVFLMKYIVPFAAIAVLLLLYFRVLNGPETQEFFANG